MWDSPLYAVNMFYYHCLINKLFWAYGRAEKSKTAISSRDGREKKVKSGRFQILTKKPHPHAEAQINRNGLI